MALFLFRVFAELLKHNQEGSIPACAGEPRLSTGRPTLGRVYPRVCGGTTTSRLWPRYTWGLSPRVRGNQMASVPIEERQGSIPACAGEPFVAASRSIS